MYPGAYPVTKNFMYILDREGRQSSMTARMRVLFFLAKKWQFPY